MYLKYMFTLFALILAFMIIFFKLHMQNKNRTEKTAVYVSFIVWSFVFYVISAFLLAFFIKDTTNKIILIIFGLSPFLIGKFASYEKENLYSYLQVFCAIISAGYVCLT